MEDVEEGRVPNEVRRPFSHYYSHSLTSYHTFYFRQISKKALERNETHRAEYRLRMGERYNAAQLVFVDESACDRRTFLRDRAWALEGLRACRKQVFARGKRYVP